MTADQSRLGAVRECLCIAKDALYRIDLIEVGRALERASEWAGCISDTKVSLLAYEEIDDVSNTAYERMRKALEK